MLEQSAILKASAAQNKPDDTEYSFYTWQTSYFNFHMNPSFQLYPIANF